MTLMIVIMTMMKITTESFEQKIDQCSKGLYIQLGDQHGVLNHHHENHPQKVDDHLGSKGLHVQLRDQHVVLLVLHLIKNYIILYGDPDVLGIFLVVISLLYAFCKYCHGADSTWNFL